MTRKTLLLIAFCLFSQLSASDTTQTNTIFKPISDTITATISADDLKYKNIKTLFTSLYSHFANIAVIQTIPSLTTTISTIQASIASGQNINTSIDVARATPFANTHKTQPNPDDREKSKETMQSFLNSLPDDLPITLSLCITISVIVNVCHEQDLEIWNQALACLEKIMQDPTQIDLIPQEIIDYINQNSSCLLHCHMEPE